MKNRLPLILSATAFVVAIFGATPLGNAAVRVVRSVPPLAAKSNYATVAGNAQHLNGHAASASGGPGSIPILNKAGKLPASIGAVGPQGPVGPAGPSGSAGSGSQINVSKLLSSNVDIVAKSRTENGSGDVMAIMCPSPQQVAIGGGVLTPDVTMLTSGSWPVVPGRSYIDGPPDTESGPPTGWATRVATWNEQPAKNVLVRFYAVCVQVGT